MAVGTTMGNFTTIKPMESESILLMEPLSRDNLRRVATNHTPKGSSRMFIDITLSRERRLGCIQFCLGVLEEKTNMMWGIFLKKKSDMPIKAYHHLKMLEGQEVNLQKLIIRMDKLWESRCSPTPPDFLRLQGPPP